jgi:hypothetical protein
MATLGQEELNLIKQKTSVYLTKSIYKLCLLLGEDMEKAMASNSLSDLLGTEEKSQMQIDSITSLYNQIVALKKIS